MSAMLFYYLNLKLRLINLIDYLNIKTSQSIFNNEDLKKLIECNIYSINISGNDNIQIKIK